MDFTKFKENISLVNSRIDDTLRGDPDSIYEASRYISEAGGKRLRPLICLLSSVSVGGDVDGALSTAAAIELIHTFTLVHDDIMDNDDTRRGMPTVHKKYGSPTAILVGDLLFAKAFELCDPSAVNILAKNAAEICEGQQMDISFESRQDVSETDYMEMIRRKTAVLFQGAARSGAIIGGGTDEQVNALSIYGRDLGLAFQMHDDLLDVTGSAKEIGKPRGSDIRAGKKTLLAIKAIETTTSCDPGISKILREILNTRENSDSDVEQAISILKECGAVDYCAEKTGDLIENAKRSISILKDSKEKQELMNIADFVIGRNI